MKNTMDDKTGFELPEDEDQGTCDKCGKERIGWFAAAFRKNEMRRGRPDPGTLCGSCAGSLTGNRLADEALSADGAQNE